MVLIAGSQRTDVFHSTTSRNCPFQPERWILRVIHEGFYGKYHAITCW